RALRAGQTAAGGGADVVLAAARGVLAAQPALAVDYVALVDPGTFGPAETGPALLVAAARAGTTRLIDNMALVLPAEGAGDAAHDCHRKHQHRARRLRRRPGGRA